MGCDYNWFILEISNRILLWKFLIILKLNRILINNNGLKMIFYRKLEDIYNELKMKI